MNRRQDNDSVVAQRRAQMQTTASAQARAKASGQQAAKPGHGLRLVCLSDIHSLKPLSPIPEGDVLIVAGDVCGYGTLDEIKVFNAFLGGLPHPHKLLIAGNHDWPFARVPEQAIALLRNAIYLKDSCIEINDIKFWGSPWQPNFCNWAFNLPRGASLAKVWAQIPDDTDVLITHGPPYGILDQVPGGEHVGCEELLKALQRVRPKVHIFGHIHEGYGVLQQDGTTFVNASVCNERYRPINAPIVIDL